ncbi:ankyrin repeat protein, partial [Baffinella frigidus]
LFVAAKFGRGEVLQLLLEKNADVSAQCKQGWSPLHSAADRGNDSAVKLLLDHGASVEAKSEDDGQTSLHVAARQGEEQVLKLLLDKGADVSAVAFGGRTP